jgi:vacuolar-type H+-ATPase subunit F/Vma7
VRLKGIPSTLAGEAAVASGLVAVILDPYTAQLFRLAGLLVYEASTREEAVKAIREVEARRDVALLLVAAELYDQVAEELEALRRSSR